MVALPVTEDVGDELFIFPIYSEFTDEQVKEVVDALRDCGSCKM